MDFVPIDLFGCVVTGVLCVALIGRRTDTRYTFALEKTTSDYDGDFSAIVLYQPMVVDWLMVVNRQEKQNNGG